jgi:hypothetical protein
MMTQGLDTFFRFGEGQLRELLEENPGIMQTWDDARLAIEHSY